MEKRRALKLIDHILAKALETNSLEILKAELAGTEFAELKNRLSQLAGMVVAPPVDPPSTLSPFTIKAGRIHKDNQVFMFAGFNMREFAHYRGDPQILRWSKPEYMQGQLDFVKNVVKAKVVRFYAPHHTLNTPEIINRTRAALNLIQSYGLHAIVVLTDNAPSGFHVDDSPENRTGAGYTHRFFANGFREKYLPFVDTITKELFDHPAILSWEIGNEFRTPFPPAPTQTQMDAILNFFRDTSNLIRRNSPTKLISTGLESCWQLFVLHAYDGGKYAEKLYSLPNIDIGTWHTYETGAPLGSAGDHIARELQLNVKVAFIVEEIGLAERGEVADWYEVLWRVVGHRASGMLQWGLGALHNNNFGVGDGMWNDDRLWDQGRRWHHLRGFWISFSDRLRMLFGS